MIVENTIVAVATSLATTSAINIIKISGKDAFALVQSVFSCAKLPAQPAPNYMYLGRIVGENFSERAFCVFFKAPHSYTGEDVAEIHCHGGIAVTREVLRMVLENGARMAEAGEFTKRAFLNDKLTLAAAEGVADMINAETVGQVKNAYKLMSGQLTEGIAKAEETLFDAAAYLEVKMDYPDELEEDVKPWARKKIDEAIAETERLLEGSKNSKIIRSGIDVAIIGSPNVGKSSLLNAILQEDRAIVTPKAGTTRDVIRESVEYDGIKLNFLDTAGIRESEDDVERAGIERSKKAVKTADVVVLVKDLSQEKDEDFSDLLTDRKVVVVGNKSDLAVRDTDGIRVCAATGENVDQVLRAVVDQCVCDRSAIDGIVTNERHVSALRECKEHLTAAKENYDVVPTECTVVDLYAAAEALGKITGNTASDEVIDTIFKKFCVGK